MDWLIGDCWRRGRSLEWAGSRFADSEGVLSAEPAVCLSKGGRGRASGALSSAAAAALARARRPASPTPKANEMDPTAGGVLDCKTR